MAGYGCIVGYERMAGYGGMKWYCGMKLLECAWLCLHALHCYMTVYGQA